MSVLHLNLLEGNEATKTKEGWEVRVTALVCGVEGSSDCEKLYNAVEGSHGLPALFSAHPIFTNSYLRRITPRQVDRDDVKVELLYQTGTFHYSTTEYEFGATSNQVETNTDGAGNDLWTQYTYPANYPIAAFQGLTETQGGTISRYIPEASFTVRRRENITKNALMAKIKNYQNHVNLVGWDIDPTAPTGSWLCTEIRGRSDPAGGFLVNYAFSYRPPFLRGSTWYPGWTDTLVFIDPNTGKPPDPSTWGANTIKIGVNYPTADFDDLDLD